MGGIALAAVALAGAQTAIATPITSFTAGDLVVSVYGDGDGSGTYTDNAAAPITLDEVTTSGAAVGQLVLPQTTTTTGSVTNFAISGEYGSSSEGTLEQSANGQYLTIAGYGVNAATFNAAPQSYGGGTKTCITPGPAAVTCFPLGQTSSVPGFAPSSAALADGVTSTITVPRVVALIGVNGSVNTSTSLTGVFNENNPRSVATATGTSFYLSGQGFNKSDTTTQGLFYAPLGATTATPIDTSFDTRTVEIQNNQLYLSADSTEGSGVHENISSYGTPGSLPTTASTATVLPNLQSKFTVTSPSQLNTLDNTVDPIAGGTKIYLSPENYFFANSTTLYVADSGNPKGDNNGAGSSTQGLCAGGLQKWSLEGSSWVLDYTLSAGLLDFVPDTTACGSNEVDCGTTGLIGLTGEDVTIDGVSEVELFATNSTLGDEDQTYLYGITDVLADMTLPTGAMAEDFSVLDTAAPDTNIRGVAFAPVPEPNSLSLLAVSVLSLGVIGRRRRRT